MLHYDNAPEILNFLNTGLIIKKIGESLAASPECVNYFDYNMDFSCLEFASLIITC